MWGRLQSGRATGGRGVVCLGDEPIFFQTRGIVGEQALQCLWCTLYGYGWVGGIQWEWCGYWYGSGPF